MPRDPCDPEAPAPSEPRRIGAFIGRGGQLLFEGRSNSCTRGPIGGPLEGDETVTEGIAAYLANRVRPVAA